MNCRQLLQGCVPLTGGANRLKSWEDFYQLLGYGSVEFICNDHRGNSIGSYWHMETEEETLKRREMLMAQHKQTGGMRKTDTNMTRAVKEFIEKISMKAMSRHARKLSLRNLRSSTYLQNGHRTDDKLLTISNLRREATKKVVLRIKEDCDE